MKTPCEIIVKQILPQIRAMVTLKLKQDYELPGREIANLVGTTEAAVSQYLHGTRGVNKEFVEDFPEIPEFVETAAKELYRKRKEGMELTEKLGEICGIIKDNEKFVALYSQGGKPASCGICLKEPNKE